MPRPAFFCDAMYATTSMYVQCRVAMCICAKRKRQKRAHNEVSQKILSESFAVAVTKEGLCGNTILNGVEIKI